MIILLLLVGNTSKIKTYKKIFVLKFFVYVGEIIKKT